MSPLPILSYSTRNLRLKEIITEKDKRIMALRELQPE